ncbi:MAG: transcriptional repressor NrdR [Verrucomicrobia bacterium]|nr:MAG: transcriptional repressor NrdR [Verrucomicrobiota bacterium]
MYCSKCGALEDKVIDSRPSKDGKSIRRRRECVSCAFRYTTYEQIEQTEMRVVKRDGRSEPLDKQKIISGMLKACEKRPVTLQTIEAAVEEIISSLEAGLERELSSRAVGAKVMEALHGLDEIAYVRYASVYRQFEDLGEFIDEIAQLGTRTKRSELQTEMFKA